MASKATRTALIAVSAVGASGVLAMSASAATPPTIPSVLVNQPAVAPVTALTPESATLNGVIDTGGTTGSTFTLAAGATLYWDNSFNLFGGTAGATEHVDGLPADFSTTATYPTSSSTTTLANAGADNYSTVLFQADPAADYNANGGNFGPETVVADEVNVPTAPGLSPVTVNVGGYPAATADPLSGPLEPSTKYVYAIEQQAGATEAAQTVNTYNGSATGVNPTYSCFPDSYIGAVSPYNSYTTTGTLSGGITATGGPAQTTPQPEIQGPCVYYYGGGANYYNSNPATFTTPALGVVKVIGNGLITATKTSHTKVVKVSKKVTKKVTTTTLSHIKGYVVVADQSIEKALGSLQLTYNGKQVASAKFNVSPRATKTVTLTLTGYGKTLAATGKAFTTKLNYTTTTDQPTTTKNVTL